MKLAQDAHQLLRLDRVGEARPAAEVGEEHRDLAAMAAQDRLVARRDDRVGELRRQEAAQLPEPLQLLDLAGHAFLERPVELAQLRGLFLDRVVVPLDPEQRPHSREQLVVVERLGNEVVRPGLDRFRLLGTDARRDHDHRQDCRFLVFAQLLADRVTVHPGHDDVEQD